ncbi:cysteine proteinase [Phlegmacium glaucopus]|nr:cysteine proteinase [Phlegmacium glaucopus]
MDTLSSMFTLRSEYENGSAMFVKQINWLIANGYDSIRRTRGDGDCFYRSLGFAYVEGLLRSTDQELAVATSLTSLTSINETLHSAGIEKLVYEDFYAEFASLIENIVKPNSEGMKLTVDVLLNAFQNPEVSNSVVIYLRFLTSAQIRLNRESYEGFVVHPDTKDIMDVDLYCTNIVQSMGKEADNVEIEALSRALHLNIDVAYLNGGRGDGVTDFIKFRYDLCPEAPPLILLYRPGHYDILVQKHGN